MSILAVIEKLEPRFYQRVQSAEQSDPIDDVSSFDHQQCIRSGLTGNADRLALLASWGCTRSNNVDRPKM